MRLRTLLLVLLLAIVTAFIAVNWNAFTAPTSLDLVITSIQAPLGLVMVGLLSTLVVAFALYIVFWQSALLVDMRRNAKEMQQHRTLADQAEASRFTELRTAMLEQMKLLNGYPRDKQRHGRPVCRIGRPAHAAGEPTALASRVFKVGAAAALGIEATCSVRVGNANSTPTAASSRIKPRLMHRRCSE